MSKRQKMPINKLLEPLKFKTGGLRGIMREGLNGINEVTTNIFATELNKRYNSILIGYDHRSNSEIFAYILAKIFLLSKNLLKFISIM
jgi:phosphomannomutase